MYEPPELDPSEFEYEPAVGLKSEVCRLAAELREEGYLPSEAMSYAWASARGEVEEQNPPRRRNSKTGGIMPKINKILENPFEPMNFAILVGVGTVGWYLWKRELWWDRLNLAGTRKRPALPPPKPVGNPKPQASESHHNYSRDMVYQPYVGGPYYQDYVQLIRP